METMNLLIGLETSCDQSTGGLSGSNQDKNIATANKEIIPWFRVRSVGNT